MPVRVESESKLSGYYVAFATKEHISVNIPYCYACSKSACRSQNVRVGIMDYTDKTVTFLFRSKPYAEAFALVNMKKLVLK